MVDVGSLIEEKLKSVQTRILNGVDDRVTSEWVDFVDALWVCEEETVYWFTSEGRLYAKTLEKIAIIYRSVLDRVDSEFHVQQSRDQLKILFQTLHRKESRGWMRHPVVDQSVCNNMISA